MILFVNPSSRGAIDENEKEPELDPALLYLTTGERESNALTRTEKFQRALTVIGQGQMALGNGRDTNGTSATGHHAMVSKLEYHGIAYGFEDLGRDLICIKGDDIRASNASVWSAVKSSTKTHLPAHRNWIMYESTRTIDQSCSKNQKIIRGCSLQRISPIPPAKFASNPGVRIVQNLPLGRYPRNQVHVSLREVRKYLPFDQQYDRTLIDIQKTSATLRPLPKLRRLGRIVWLAYLMTERRPPSACRCKNVNPSPKSILSEKPNVKPSQRVTGDLKGSAMLPVRCNVWLSTRLTLDSPGFLFQPAKRVARPV